MKAVQKLRRTPAPAFKFSMLDIPLEAELIYTKDENIRCIVVSDNKVSYDGAEYSLSALSQQLLDYKYGVQGTLYWMYEGKILTELRKEKEQRESNIDE